MTDPPPNASSLGARATEEFVTADFAATDALTNEAFTSNTGTQGRALDDPATITLMAPAGLTFSENTSHMRSSAGSACTVLAKTAARSAARPGGRVRDDPDHRRRR